MKWLLAVFVLAFCVVARPAGAVNIGVGAFGGVSVPIVQDDNGQGSSFGVRVPVKLNGLLTLEPYFASTGGGDAKQTILGVDYTRSGFDISSYGVNALLTFGGKLQLYPFATFSTNKLTRIGTEDLTMTSMGGGLGLGISPMPKLTVHLRGSAESLTKGNSGRVFANVTAGLSYALYPFAAK